MEEKIIDGLIYAYDEEEYGYVLIGAVGKIERLQVPCEVEGNTVAAIGEEAFSGHTELREISFEERMGDRLKICDHAFDGCTGLTELELPYFVGWIGRSAFRYCTSLERVELEDFSTYVCPYAFSGCSALRSITPLSHLSENAFEDCVSLLEAPIHSCARSIDEGCFERCTSLKRVTIPASVKRIESLAFRGCRALEAVIFEDPEGWSQSSACFPDDVKLNLKDPKRNAAKLSGMDFDDGVHAWTRREKTPREKKPEPEKKPETEKKEPPKKIGRKRKKALAKEADKK